MDFELIERLRTQLLICLRNAQIRKEDGQLDDMRSEMESAAVILDDMCRRGYRPSGEELRSHREYCHALGLSESDCDILFGERTPFTFTRKEKEPNPKPNLRGKSSGGKSHKKRKGKATRPKHEKGRATKQQDYGGEKGDEARSVPRRRPKGHKGPWP